MYNIKTLNKISNVGLSKFDKSKYVYGDDIENPDAIMVRSASMHDMEMPKSLLAIAQTISPLRIVRIRASLFSTHPVQTQMP